MRKLFVQFQCALPAIQAFGWSTLSGVFGTWILAGFFSTIMSLELLSMLLAPVVGINASISGYMLFEKNGQDLVHPTATATAVGVLVAILSFIGVNLFCYQTGGFILMSGLQALIATVIAAFGGWSGGVLAIKYRKLKEQSADS